MRSTTQDGGATLRGSRLSAVNVRETDEGSEVHVAAPGVQKGDCDVNVEDGVLCISAERRHGSSEGDDEHGGYHRREFTYASLERSFHFPATSTTSRLPRAAKTASSS